MVGWDGSSNSLSREPSMLRKSLKKCTIQKLNIERSLNGEHVNQIFGAFVQDFSTRIGLYF